MSAFSNITPEDFDPQARVPSMKAVNFDAFVEGCLFTMRNAVVLRAGSLPIPMIVGVDRFGNAWPIPSPGGTMEGTMPYVREQLDERGGSWFFFAIQTQVGWYHDENPASADDPEIHAGYQEQGAAAPGVFYYAAMRNGPMEMIRRSGCGRFAGNDLGPLRDMPAEQPVAILDSVLL